MKRHILISCAIGCLAAITARSVNLSTLPDGVSVSKPSSMSFVFGSNIVWSLAVMNSSTTSYGAIIAIDIDAVTYDGNDVADVQESVTTNFLNPLSTASVSITVSPASYTNWSGLTPYFRASSVVELAPSSNVWISQDVLSIVSPTNLLTLSPTNVTLGGGVTSRVEFVNSLAATVHNVRVLFAVGSGLNTNGESLELVQEIGSISPGATAVSSTNFVAARLGTHSITAVITADELAPWESDGVVEVHE